MFPQKCWAHKPMVEKYPKNMALKNMSTYFFAIIQVESDGTAEDVMQSSNPRSSTQFIEYRRIHCKGVKYLSELLASSERLSVDLESVIQSYNYGGGFLGHVANRGNKYTFELAQKFLKEYSIGGEKKVFTPIP